MGQNCPIEKAQIIWNQEQACLMGSVIPSLCIRAGPRFEESAIALAVFIEC